MNFRPRWRRQGKPGGLSSPGHLRFLEVPGGWLQVPSPSQGVKLPKALQWILTRKRIAWKLSSSRRRRPCRAELQQDETVAEETVAVDTMPGGASSQGLGDERTDATTTLEEVRGAGLPSHPGWLFSEETLQLAAAHDIRSAVVDGREVLLPRPKQRPGVAGQKVGMVGNLRAEQPSNPPLDPGMAVPGKDDSLRLSHSSAATRRSRWPGWKYARLATNPNGTERRWRTSRFAISLKRPWRCNWRQLYREMNCTWQLLSTSTVQDAWRLTCGYRLAFSRRQWPQIQAKLANITGHPKCEAIRRLIRAHQRLEERHRPEQPSVVRAYTLGSACLSIAITTLHPQSFLPLVPVTGRRLLPSTTSGILLACAQHPRLQVSVSVPPIAGRPMPRPLPGTTGKAVSIPQLGLCQTLGPALRSHVRQRMGSSYLPQEHGICVVFLPSPRCQVCYRRHMFAAIDKVLLSRLPERANLARCSSQLHRCFPHAATMPAGP